MPGVGRGGSGVVGRPHGLDGSFYVSEPDAALLELGATVTLAGAARTIVRRAGTDGRPIIRSRAATTATARRRCAASSCRSTTGRCRALGPDEWWAEELEGARVFDGERELGVVRRLLALPSCECLEVRALRRGARPARPARARRDPRGRRRAPRGSTSISRFLGEADVKIDVVTLFPAWFEWFRAQRHVANALAAGSTLTTINPRDHTPLSGGQVDDAPFGGGAGMVLRVDVMDATLRAPLRHATRCRCAARGG